MYSFRVRGGERVEHRKKGNGGVPVRARYACVNGGVSASEGQIHMLSMACVNGGIRVSARYACYQWWRSSEGHICICQ